MKVKYSYFGKQIKYVSLFASLLIVILFFQNCGQSSFQTRVLDQAELASESSSSQSDLANESFANDDGIADVNDINVYPEVPQGVDSSDNIVVVTPMDLTSSTGKIYYVSTKGSNTNSGTISSPFRTVGYAVGKMVAGDTTYVRAGLYNETSINFLRSGTQLKPIKLLNYPGESPIIDFGVTSTNGLIRRIMIDAPGDDVPIGWITIEGFEIRNGHESIKYDSAHNITIRRNRMHHNKNSAVLATSGKNVLFDRNTIYHNGPQDITIARVHGMYLTGSNYVITNNLIYTSGCYGIQAAGYPWDMLQYSEKPMDYKRGPDASYAGAANWTIANNTFAYNGCAGIVLWRSLTDNAKIFNNIFYENSVKGKSSSSTNGINFVSVSGQTGHKIQNNLFYASGSGGTKMFGINGIEGVHYTQSGNRSANPNFVNAPAVLPSSPNFTLRSGSPAIDRGLASTVTKIDYKGVSRPKGAAYDIGAIEFIP